MSTDPEQTETHPTGSALAITTDQTGFTTDQTAALSHIGVQDAPESDLRVFFHICQQSGLDPYARQIYMISRNESYKDENGVWQKRKKWTIQTGIDGFYVTGHRAARRDKVAIGTKPVEFAHQDGSWRGAWSNSWGFPVAARATVIRDGQEFIATANFDDYVKYNANGDPILTGTWKDRYAGQIAKCATALAWRMAFPQDLSGVYVTEEMDQHDAIQGEIVTQNARPVSKAKSLDALRAAVKPAKLDNKTRSQIANAFIRAGFASDPATDEGRTDRFTYITNVLASANGGEVTIVESTADLTPEQANTVLDALAADEADITAEPDGTP